MYYREYGKGTVVVRADEEHIEGLSVKNSARDGQFIHYDCEARNAVLRIASRLQGRSLPVSDYGMKKNSLFRRLFSRPLKEVLPIDDH